MSATPSISTISFGLSTPTDRTPQRRTIQMFALVAILILAMLLRLYNINKESFWADEGWTMLLSKGPTLSDIVRTMADDQHPPLYFAILHYWIDLTGNSEKMVRLLSTFWSVLSIALTYRLTARLFSSKAGLAAALMLALQDNDIMLSQEARHYTQVVMFALASTMFYFEYLRNVGRPKRSAGVGWLLASIAMMYTHYLGAFILLIQFLHALIFVRPFRRWLDVFFRVALVGVAWLPWAFVFWEQSLIRYTRPILFQSALPNTRAAFDIVLGDLFGHQAGLTVGLLVLGLCFVTYTISTNKIHARIRIRPLSATAYMLIWLVVPFVSIVIVNSRFPIMTTRNFLLITPPILILIGHGITNLDRFAQRLLLIILVVVALTTVDAYQIKPPWRKVATDILSHRLGAEPILMDIWVEDFALRYHLGRDLQVDPTTLPLISFPAWRDQYRENFSAYLKEYLKDKNAFWLAFLGKDEDNTLGFLTGQGFTQTGVYMNQHLAEPIYIFRYDRTDETALTTFGDQLELTKAEFGKQNNALTVNLVWRAVKPIDKDYSVSVFLLDSAGKLVAQNDSPPLDGTSLTSTWQPGALKFDSHVLEIPTGYTGKVQIGLKVYWYGDQLPLRLPNDAEYWVIGNLDILP